MYPGDLPKVGKITNALDAGILTEFTEISGKNLLCLGMSEAELNEHIVPHEPASITVLTFWADHKDAEGGAFPIVMGDVTKKTPFSDGAFDTVLSTSVLEHVSDIGAALNEMARLTRRGGDMVHIFGPVWSGPYGHHMCQGTVDPNLVFWMWQMPAHMHLLCSREELHEYYTELGYGQYGGDACWHWFHEAEHINRIFFDDYLRVMAPFQIDKMITMYNSLPDEHLALLRGRFPGRVDFQTYGACISMRI